MFSNKLAASSKKLVPIAAALVILAGCVSETRGQRPGPNQPSPRDAVRALERQEMDQLLLRKPLLATKDDSARRAVLKQIREDFRDMQGLNNRMMAEAWARQELDYRYISDMVSQIRDKAVRLRANLALPGTDEDDQKQTDAKFANAKEFRAGLLLLDRSIMSFVTNPLFQKANILEVDLANQASRDLAAVIGLSGKLKIIASRLTKSIKSSQ
jgi:hypothetical protein